MTIIFTSFVFLQFWNMINCTVIGADDYNIFKVFTKPLQNWLFLLVLLIVFFVQYVSCEWGLFRGVFDTHNIDGEQFGQCALIGATALIAALALKLTPAHWVEMMPIKIDEDEVMGRDNAFMKAYDDNAKGSIPDFRKTGVNDEEDSLTNPDGTRDDDDYHQA